MSTPASSSSTPWTQLSLKPGLPGTEELVELGGHRHHKIQYLWELVKSPLVTPYFLASHLQLTPFRELQIL